MAHTMRGDIVEATHRGCAVAVDADGQVVAQWGDPNQPTYYRSAIKPFQATASLRAGASLAPEHLALACSSHGGQPVHVAIVRRMLSDAFIDEAALQCPQDWPLSRSAADRLMRRGRHTPQRIFHTCSGKHAGFLRASAAAGWPLDTYLSPDHPIQRSVMDIVADASGTSAKPIGIDGCGAPVLAGTVRGLATAFVRLQTDHDFAPVRTAMHRYPALVADSTRPDGRVGAWWGGPLKAGAAGLIAASRPGISIAVKSSAGSRRVAVVTLIAVMQTLGILPDAAAAALDDVARPPVLGGGQPVGTVVPVLQAVV